jgi:hypothetical protein
MNLEQDLRRLSERVDEDQRELEPTSKTRRRIKMRRSLVGVGAVAIVAVLAVGAFALTTLDKEAGLPPASGPEGTEDLASGTYAGVDWDYHANGTDRCVALELDGASTGCSFTGLVGRDLRVWATTGNQPRGSFYTAQARLSEKVDRVKLLSEGETVGRVFLFELPPNFSPGTRVALAFVDGTELEEHYATMVAYDKDGEVLGQKELVPEDALMDPPLPVPPSEIDLHTPIDDYEELAQFDAPGVRNLFLKDATLEDVELLRELYMESMEDAGWTLVREEDQAKKLKSGYAMVQFWTKEDGDRAFSLEQLGFADFLGYESLLKFSYASCPPADLMWCGTDS